MSSAVLTCNSKQSRLSSSGQSQTPASLPPVHSHHTAEIYTQHSAPAGAAGQRTERMSPRSCKQTRSGAVWPPPNKSHRQHWVARWRPTGDTHGPHVSAGHTRTRRRTHLRAHVYLSTRIFSPEPQLFVSTNYISGRYLALLLLCLCSR